MNKLVNVLSFDGSTVEVTIGRETRRVNAAIYIHGNGYICLSVYGGLSGRYRSGGKVWPASVTVSIESEKTDKASVTGEDFVGGFERVWFGRDDRSLKFRKENAVYFAPKSAE